MNRIPRGVLLCQAIIRRLRHRCRACHRRALPAAAAAYLVHFIYSNALRLHSCRLEQGRHHACPATTPHTATALAHLIPFSAFPWPVHTPPCPTPAPACPYPPVDTFHPMFTETHLPAHLRLATLPFPLGYLLFSVYPPHCLLLYLPTPHVDCPAPRTSQTFPLRSEFCIWTVDPLTPPPYNPRLDVGWKRKKKSPHCCAKTRSGCYLCCSLPAALWFTP